jgi:hypothetical protein
MKLILLFVAALVLAAFMTEAQGRKDPAWLFTLGVTALIQCAAFLLAP